MPSSATQGLPEMSRSTRQVITLLLRRGPMARAELARQLELTPAALTKLTRPLLEIGLLGPTTARGRPSSGRPGTPLAVNPGWGRFVGVKLTEDRSFAVLTDLSGAELDADDRPLPSHQVADVCDLIIDQVNYLLPGARPTGVGVCLAGAVLRSSGSVVSSQFLRWSDVALARRLEERCGRPVSVENDVRALTAAQQWFDLSATSFALVTFGAGVGCGLVLQDHLVTGHGGTSGVVNHLRVRDQGPPCHRGHRGCVSGYATTSAILAAVREHVGTVGLPDVAGLARRGDRIARSVLADAGFAVGCLIGTICNVAAPQKVILSGEGAALFDLIDAELRRGMDEVVHPALPPIALAVKPHTFSDWARGGAVIAIQDHLTRQTHRARTHHTERDNRP